MIRPEQHLPQPEGSVILAQACKRIAHDLNNTLAGVVLYTELISGEVTDNEQAVSDAREMALAVLAAQNLVSQLFALVGDRHTDGVGRTKPVSVMRSESVILSPDANTRGGDRRSQGDG
jgi:hypothetical protein